MKSIAKLSNQDRQELFNATAINMGLQPDVIEKDFWVCYMLDHLFNDSSFNKYFVFKGGTSLSKSYHVIERFSEDIDLILDWRMVIKDNSNPWEVRSKTKQDIYNKQINKQAADFYKDILVPKLNEEISNKLGKGNWLQVDSDDEMIIKFLYPRIYEASYITPYVKLEIGPLAAWTPSHITTITPFAAEKYGHLFKQINTNILTIDVERTFWEKITILHKIANFPEEKSLPQRYARHLYDVYCLGNSYVKNKAFNKKELLEEDVIFKQKFYYAKNAHYETATLKLIKLMPSERIIPALKNDYVAMMNMLYGNKPKFDEILSYLKILEEEIHKL